MKKLIALFIAVLLVLSVAGISSATNGDNMIGVMPASRAMGGIGVGLPISPTDSIFRNPAMMSNYDGGEASFGGILFLPKVKADVTFQTEQGPWTGSDTSQAKTFVVPEIGIFYQIDKQWSFGIGAFGVSGMGVDYKNEDPILSNMHTTLQFMRIIPAVSYKINDSLSISGAIHAAWGALDMGATLCTPDQSQCWNAGGGQANSLGIGGQLGVAYNIDKKIYVGATYQTPVAMKYKRVFNTDPPSLDPAGKFEDLKLTQPQEVAAGIGYVPTNNFKVGFDVRWINWSNADGYKDFQWKDQWVFALGGEYRPTPPLALRAGWNYAKTPIRSASNANPMNANKIPEFNQPFSDFFVAYFNLVGFPAITEHHASVGIGYDFSKKFGIDLAYEHAFKKTVKVSSVAGSVEGSNEQDALTFALNWKF